MWVSGDGKNIVDGDGPWVAMYYIGLVLIKRVKSVMTQKLCVN